MKRPGIVITLCGAVLVGALLMWVVESRSKGKDETKESGQKPPQRVSLQGGEVVVSIDAATQQLNGIQVSELHGTKRREEFPATALVLSPQDLIELRNNYVAAQTQLVKAEAALNVSRQDYERLGALYREDRNASAKAFQAAEGTFHADEASLKAAQDTMYLTENNIRQRWGDVVSKWVFKASPEFVRLLGQQDLLIQVTLPPGAQFEAPRTALLQTSSKESLPARLVSALPRLDPRIQSLASLYLTAHRRGLVQGMTLAVRLPAGPEVQGVIVPQDAVVWWQGRPWAYLQKAPDQFARREVDTQSPTKSGWFVSANGSVAIRPGEKVVVTGAQQLLSEEFRSEIQVGEEGGEDER